MPKHDINSDSITIGQNVTWWTGRASQGRGIVTKIEGDRVFIQPSEDSIKGSDYRVMDSGRIWWTPINVGVPVDCINTEPDPWYKNS